MAFLRGERIRRSVHLAFAFAIAILSACANFRQHSDFWPNGGAGGSTGPSVGGSSGLSDDGGSDSGADAGGGAPTSVCGNGVREQNETCDDGTARNVGGYGKCNVDCSLGPYCGDAKINGVDEACDDGVNNGLGVGQCNPACTATVKQKAIRVLTMLNTTSLIPTNGNLTGDWDPFCATQFGVTYKALLVDGRTRIASRSPYKGDGQIDWVLAPYTRYVNAVGDLIWTTDQVALLGVRDGAAVSLLNPFAANATEKVWAGFNSDWTTSTSNCSIPGYAWSADKGLGGAAMYTSAKIIETFVVDCSAQNYLLCVEQ